MRGFFELIAVTFGVLFVFILLLAWLGSAAFFLLPVLGFVLFKASENIRKIN